MLEIGQSAKRETIIDIENQLIDQRVNDFLMCDTDLVKYEMLGKKSIFDYYSFIEMRAAAKNKIDQMNKKNG